MRTELIDLTEGTLFRYNGELFVVLRHTFEKDSYTGESWVRPILNQNELPVTEPEDMRFNGYALVSVVQI